MPAAQKDVLLKAAIAKFGKPGKTTAGEAQNRFGAKFSQVTAAWNMKDGTVLLVERCNTVAESCIVATSKDYVSPDAGKKLNL
ncbi:MAG: hypothetical protein WKH97_09945 [Casimicrobiaceae bacterium]